MVKLIWNENLGKNSMITKMYFLILITRFDKSFIAHMQPAYGLKCPQTEKDGCMFLCLGRPYHFKFLKGCLPQISLGSFLNTLSLMVLEVWFCVVSTTTLLVFFLWLVKSVKNLKIIALKWDLCSNFTVSGLLDQLQIFRLLYVIELLGLLIGLGYSSCITWFIQGFQQGLVCWSSQTQVIWNFSSDIWLYFVFSSGRLIK